MREFVLEGGGDAPPPPPPAQLTRITALATRTCPHEQRSSVGDVPDGRTLFPLARLAGHPVLISRFLPHGHRRSKEETTRSGTVPLKEKSARLMLRAITFRQQRSAPPRGMCVGGGPPGHAHALTHPHTHTLTHAHTLTYVRMILSEEAKA